MSLAYATFCSGIGAPEAAWAGLGWRSLWASEIEAFPCAVLAHHYLATPNLGDMESIDGKEAVRQYGHPDVVCAGTPCQSFSVAGLRAGMADPRGNLAIVYLRLVDAIRPRWVVWENVPGVLSSGDGLDFGSFLGALGQLGYGWAYRVLDSQYWGVAQRRRRVFVVGHSGGDWRRCAAVLFERESLRRDTQEGREKGEGVAGTVAGGARRRGGYRHDDIPIMASLTTRPNADRGDDVSRLVAVDYTNGLLGTVAGTIEAAQSKGNRGHGVLAFGGNRTSGPISIATAQNAHGGPCGRMDFESETFVVSSFQSKASASQSMNPKSVCPTLDVGKSDGMAVQTEGCVRRLTPRECERLQGFPDDYTAIRYKGKVASDGPRYKALGNSMAVPVLRWIGERIAAVDAVPLC